MHVQTKPIVVIVHTSFMFSTFLKINTSVLSHLCEMGTKTEEI